MNDPDNMLREPAHGQAQIVVARLRPAVPLTEGQERALVHVLGCVGCQRTLAKLLGPHRLCDLVQPLILPAVRETLANTALRAAILVHARGCPDCSIDLEFAERENALLRVADPGNQAVLRLTLALVNAALAGEATARQSLLDWLGSARRPTAEIARSAVASAYPEAAQRAGAVLAALPLLSEAEARQDAVALLRQHHVALEALDLALSPAALLTDQRAQADDRGLAALISRVYALVREKQFAPALALLAGRPEPLALDLQAMVHSLAGNLEPALDAARQAYRHARGQVAGLFTPAGQLPFALAWQYAPAAATADNAVLVVDALAPQQDILYQADPVRLHVDRDRLAFSLGVQLPPGYTGHAFRVFVVDALLRQLLDLRTAVRLREAFRFRPSGPPTEQEHILVVESTVLTAAGGILEGTVSESGTITVWEPVVSTGQAPEAFFLSKTVVVALYPPGEQARPA